MRPLQELASKVIQKLLTDLTSEKPFVVIMKEPLIFTSYKTKQFIL